jgi:uncharacterized phage-associated protein
MSYDGRAIANFVLDFCENRNREVTNLSLQKIVYFCHVWSLIELGRPLVKHKFEAWDYGPVLPYLYREFKKFDKNPVTNRATGIDTLDGRSRIIEYNFDAATTDLLNRVADFYSRMRASDLVSLSHVTGGPWDQVWNHEGTINPGMKIEDEKITSFYSRMPRPFPVQ